MTKLPVIFARREGTGFVSASFREESLELREFLDLHGIGRRRTIPKLASNGRI